MGDESSELQGGSRISWTPVTPSLGLRQGGGGGLVWLNFKWYEI